MISRGHILGFFAGALAIGLGAPPEAKDGFSGVVGPQLREALSEAAYEAYCGAGAAMRMGPYADLHEGIKDVARAQVDAVLKELEKARP